MKRSTCLFTLVVSVAILLGGCGSKEVNQAEKLIDAGMYAEAASLLRKHVNDNPTDANAHYLLGTVFLATGDATEAGESFLRALKLDDRYKAKAVQSYFDAGKELLKETSPVALERALGYISSAVAVDNTRAIEAAGLCRDRGIALSSSDPRLSRIVLVEALRYNPDLAKDEEVFFAYRIVNAQTTNLNNQGCEEFVALFPNSSRVSEVYYNLGDYQYNASEFGKAKEYFKLAVAKAGVTEFAAKAQSRLHDITEIESNQSLAEQNRIRAIKEAEIVRQNQMAQIEAQAAANKAQLQVESKRREEQLALEAARQQEEAKRRAAEAEARQRARLSTGFLDGTYNVSFVGRSNNRGTMIIKQVDREITADIRCVTGGKERGKFKGNFDGTTLTFSGPFSNYPDLSWNVVVTVREDFHMVGTFTTSKGKTGPFKASKM